MSRSCFSGSTGGRCRPEFPHETSYFPVVLRLCLVGGGQEVSGALEKLGTGVRHAGELAAGPSDARRRSGGFGVSPLRQWRSLVLAESSYEGGRRETVGRANLSTFEIGAASITKSASRTSLMVEARATASNSAAFSSTSGESTPTTSQPALRAARPMEPPIRPTPTMPSVRLTREPRSPGRPPPCCRP